MMPRLMLPFFLLAVAPLAAQQPDTVLDKTAPEWLAILKDNKDTKWRRASLIALEVFGPRTRGVVPALVESLDKETEPEVRREAALVLGRMGPDAKEAVPHLAEALKKDKSEVVREAAARALAGKLNDFAHDQVLVLAAALKDPHVGTRAAAAEALRNFGDKAQLAVPHLTDIVKDAKADRLLRLYAIQIVSRLHEDPADRSKLLLGIVDDAAGHVSLRVAALEGIGRSETLAAGDVQALGRMLKDKSLDLRRAGASALAKHGSAAGPLWADVKAALKDADNTVRYQLVRVAAALAPEQKEAVDVLAQAALGDAHVENRLAAIQELGQLEATAAGAADVLSKIASGDARASIRDAAAAALKRVQKQ